jgi:hypothetical protein
VSEVVEALAGSGGPETAAELYRDIAARWAETRSRETLN